MKPRVLVSSPLSGETNYSSALSHFGLSVTSKYCPSFCNRYDALVLSGGGDIHPSLYNHQNEKSYDIDLNRDICEIRLAEAFMRANKPILGICRGIQLLNVAFGGTLCQNVTNTHLHRALSDSYDNLHLTDNIRSTFAYELWGKHAFVNSAHHQACDKIAGIFHICQMSADGVAEAISDGKKVIGVQWHPERMVLKYKRNKYSDASRLFDYFKKMI